MSTERALARGVAAPGVTAGERRDGRRVGLAAAIAALGLAALLAPAALAGGDEESAQQAGRLARRNELLKRQAELAKAKDFYLIYDVQTRSLRLMLQGVALREYAVRDARIGAPRHLSLHPPIPSEWVNLVWQKGTLDPERELDRFEIVATGTEEEIEEMPIPPLPEEAIKAPGRFFIRYPSGFSVEVRNTSGVGAEPVTLSFWGRVKETVRAILKEREQAKVEIARLMLQLDDNDAAALYRSLPPNTHFMVLYP